MRCNHDGIAAALLLLAVAAPVAVSAAEQPRPASRPSEAPITLALAGDVMLGRLMNEAIRERGTRDLWGDVLPLLRGSSLTFVNLECVIARGGRPFEPPRVFYFRAAPEAVGALTAAGIDFVSLANNHAMDFGPAALLETIDHLERSGIAHAGAGRDLADASRPALLESGGLKIGVVAFADHFTEYGATEAGPGTNVIPIDPSAKDFSRARKAIRSARERGADLVIFSIHWGPNMREAPSTEFVAFARAVIDAGADVFHGHSAHVFQGIEIHHGKPIFYDTGDLIDDYAVDPRLRNDLQLLFVLTVGRDGVRRIELFPLRIRHRRVERALEEDFAAIEERIRRSSRVFGTTIRKQADRLVVVGSE